MLQRSAILGAVVALLLAGSAEAAGSATGNLRVQATVLSACGVQDSTLDFGQVSPAAGTTGQRPQTNLRVTCTNGVPYTVGLGDGSNTETGQRRMKRTVFGAGTTHIDYLNYELYKSLTGSDRFGDAIITERVSGVGTGTTQNVPVFGALPGGQDAGTGNFADDVLITVRF